MYLASLPLLELHTCLNSSSATPPGHLIGISNATHPKISSCYSPHFPPTPSTHWNLLLPQSFAKHLMSTPPFQLLRTLKSSLTPSPTPDLLESSKYAKLWHTSVQNLPEASYLPLKKSDGICNGNKTLCGMMPHCPLTHCCGPIPHRLWICCLLSSQHLHFKKQSFPKNISFHPLTSPLLYSYEVV